MKLETRHSIVIQNLETTSPVGGPIVLMMSSHCDDVYFVMAMDQDGVELECSIPIAKLEVMHEFISSALDRASISHPKPKEADDDF